MLAGWLPWVQYMNRTTFTFYSIVILPWMILAICYVVNWLRQNSDSVLYRQTMIMGLTLLGLTSVFFYPLWTAMPIPYDFWRMHMWLSSWI